MLSYDNTQAIQKWKLTELDACIDQLNEDISEAASKEGITADANYPFVVLRICGKAMLVFREIITLCAAGYSDGALSLARNIYEQFIILSFFEARRNDSCFSDFIEDYCIDYSITIRELQKKEYIVCGKENESKTIEEEIEVLKQQCHREYGKIKGNKYWWTGENSLYALKHLLIQEENDAGVKRLYKAMYIYYECACLSLHASSAGNIYRCGIEANPSVIDTSPLLSGQEEPLYFATISFIPITAITCRLLKLDFCKYSKHLHKLAAFYQNKGKDGQNND